MNGARFLNATVGVPNDAADAAGNPITITFFKNGPSDQIGAPVNVSAGQSVPLHPNLQGASQLDISCAAINNATHQGVDLNFVLGSATYLLIPLAEHSGDTDIRIEFLEKKINGEPTSRSRWPAIRGSRHPAVSGLPRPGRRIGAYFLSIPLAIITLGIGYAIWGLIVWGGTTPALQVLGMRLGHHAPARDHRPDRRWHPRDHRAGVVHLHAFPARPQVPA